MNFFLFCTVFVISLVTLAQEVTLGSPYRDKRMGVPQSTAAYGFTYGVGSAGLSPELILVMEPSLLGINREKFSFIGMQDSVVEGRKIRRVMGFRVLKSQGPQKNNKTIKVLRKVLGELNFEPANGEGTSRYRADRYVGKLKGENVIMGARSEKGFVGRFYIYYPDRNIERRYHPLEKMVITAQNRDIYLTPNKNTLEARGTYDGEIDFLKRALVEGADTFKRPTSKKSENCIFTLKFI